MKCDFRLVDQDQVELRLVVPKQLVDQVTRDAPTYGQMCKAIRERIEASLARPGPPVLQRIY